MKKQYRRVVRVALAAAALGGIGWNAGAADDDAAEAKRAEMQRALNQEVMSSKFDPGDVKKAQSYAEQAKKDNIVPVAQAPSYWQPGWTCGNMVSYYGYAYGDYRACVYYHYYYGRYWR